MITNSDVQLFAGFLAAIALVMSIYVFLFYIPQRTNRWLSLMLLFLSINNYAIEIMAGSKTVDGVMPGLLLSACITPAMIPGLLLAGLMLVKPTWLHGRWRWNGILLQALTAAPILFVLFDQIFGAHLINKGFPPNGYTGGIVNLSTILNGPVGMVIFFVNIVFTLVGACAVFVYLAGFDKSLSPLTHRLTWFLAIAQIISTAFLIIPGNIVGNGVLTLAGTMIYIVLYTYAAFQLSTPERFTRDGTWTVKSTGGANGILGVKGVFKTKVSLPTRLTALMMGVCLPLTITVTVLINQRVNQLIRQDAVNRLQWVSQSVAERISTWLDVNSQALTQMVLLRDIQNMEPVRQKPILQAMILAHPDYSFVSVVDLDGVTVSRSDDAPAGDYSDRSWLKEITTGARMAYQIAQDKTSGKPVLELAVPARNNQGVLVGIGMFAVELSRFSSQVKFTTLGTTGVAYIVDSHNKMVVNPNPDLALRDYSQEQSVARLRQDNRAGALSTTTIFKDNTGKEWLAYGAIMSNGWAVIAQQQKYEAFRDFNSLERISITIIVIGTALLLVLIWQATNRVVQPIHNLAKTASEIASGEMTRIALVESEDEIGILARAFNALTTQLRNSLSELEKQIAERTLDLEVRSSYLQASAEVSRIVASILDPFKLSQEVVDLIRERFGLYYVGLFQVEKNREWAVLKAGTGRVGLNMAAQGYRIGIGSGMIGWCIANAQPRISLDSGGEPARQRQTDSALMLDLPETRSEAALPLRSRGQVIGALTLQSAVPGAFDKENITVFQTLADQVAIALDNARLFSEGQEALRTMQQMYGEMSREAWEKLMHGQGAVAYRADIQGVTNLSGAIAQAGKSSPSRQQPLDLADDGQKNDNQARFSLEIPIKVRGNIIGILDTHKPDENRNWKPEEVAMIQTMADQLGLALESAQLYRESQYRAERERLISQITTQMRESLDVDTVLQTAAREMLKVLGLQDIAIHLGEAHLQETATVRKPTG
jgi:GAF domain-containing protein/HAMP domain-containing protein